MAAVAGRLVHSEKVRVLVSLGAGLAAGVLAAWWTPWQMAALIGFDVNALVQLAWIWSQIGRCTPAETRRLAEDEDDSPAAVRVVMVLASLASFVGVVLGLGHAKTLQPPMSGVLIALSVLSVALAWLLVHSTYTLRYAHVYYHHNAGGIEFPPDDEDVHPDYRDFAYVAFTVGMSFTLAETPPSTAKMRRMVTHHALLSYLFGAVIVGMVINIMASLVG